LLGVTISFAILCMLYWVSFQFSLVVLVQWINQFDNYAQC